MLKQTLKSILPAPLQSEIRKFLQGRRQAAAAAQVARDKRDRMSSRPHSRAHGLNFLFFREQPKDHWYFGAGIGAAFPSAHVARRS